jgi:hypothetical protein
MWAARSCCGPDPLKHQGVHPPLTMRGGLASRYHPERPARFGISGLLGMLGLFEAVWMLLSPGGGSY